jgi:SAM-dependent methyltransferase
MDAQHKKILKAISLELRHLLEGQYDASPKWQPGDLEKRLAAIGVRRDREPVNVEELAHLAPVDQKARQVVDAYLKLRAEAGVSREDAVAEFIRETAYTWANRLLALRCMEARELIDEVILQKPAYGGRSLEHHRLAQRQPELCAGEDDGLLAALDKVFTEQARHLPMLFDPEAPGVVLRPSAPAIKRCVALLSGTEAIRGQEPTTGDVFKAPDALGWAYQYWNTEEKDRVFTKVRTQKGAKIEGADVVPATQLYTEPYMVKFLVQNSLGATWVSMHPESKLSENWEYYVRDSDRVPIASKPIAEITFLDPACGSGHFLLEAFDLFYEMYEEEDCFGDSESPREATEICRSILDRNLFGIDIDARAVQIAEAALWMKAAERVFPDELPGVQTNLAAAVASHLKGPLWEDFLTGFTKEPAVGNVLHRFGRAMEHIDELGSLARPEEGLRAIVHDEHAKWEQARRERTDANYLFAEMRADALSGQLPLLELSDAEFGDRLLSIVRAALNTFTNKARSDGRDPSRLLGRETQIGLRWIDVLGRKYDVVAANPPYMGSKNLGAVVKRHIERCYKLGKRDIYAAFLLRSRDLLRPGGYLAMVTQQAWLFISSFEQLRKLILERDAIGLLSHHGRYAFSEITNAVVQPVLYVAQVNCVSEGGVVTAFRFISPLASEEQASLLRSTVRNPCGPSCHRSRQDLFAKVPGNVLCYWVRPRFLELLQSSSVLGRYVSVLKGLDTAENLRFVRYFWEVPWARQRWRLFPKGGGYRKWAGFNHFLVDWELGGRRIKSNGRGTPRNEHSYGIGGLTYTEFGRGCLGVRILPTDAIFSTSSPGIMLESDLQPCVIQALLNCRVASYFLRVLQANMQHLGEGYLPLVPVPDFPPVQSDRLALAAIGIKTEIISRSPCESEFLPRCMLDADVGRVNSVTRIGEQAVLHTLEGILERIVFDAYGIDGEDRQAILQETGVPTGWLPILEGYDAFPESFRTARSSAGLDAAGLLTSLERLRVSPEQLDSLMRKLRSLYGKGFGAAVDDDDEGNPTEDDEEEEVVAFGASMPIPPETLLEELSQRLGVHPLSVYWLVRLGIEREGLRCLPEEQRVTRDWLTSQILQLLGHRWPQQVERGEPLPDWADQDGIIPLTDAGAEATVLDRLRRLGEPRRISEPDFADLMGKPLEHWLTTEFVKHHTSQFKKRPIAWQLQSARFTARKKPAFACLVYYSKLDGDLLPKLCKQYAGHLQQRMETELRGIEGVPAAARSDRQEARRNELGDQIPELQEFHAKLREVQESAFATDGLRDAAIQDGLLCLKQAWLRRLADAVRSGPIGQWLDAARESAIHADLSGWIEVAMSQLERYCTRVGPDDSEWDSGDDPTPATAARFICTKPSQMVTEALTHANGCWAGQVFTVVISPLRQQISEKQERQKALKAELKASTEGDTTVHAIGELKAELDRLKIEIRDLQAQVEDIQGRCDRLRALITEWHCPGVDDWESWLAVQPLYDAISSVDGRRRPPTTVQEWVAQEQSYFPDINDGVRVNIAPLQKAGLLAADVLAKKDLDKAIADRAEWRRDERRWVREGKLPQPGWWPKT